MPKHDPLAETKPQAYALHQPTQQIAPVVFASPHSGRYYPPDFVAASRLDVLSLRRSEDAFVEMLFATAPKHGAPLLTANYARAYCDLNREPYELDPAMFSSPLPTHAKIRSPRVAAGLGTIARTVGAGMEIYRGKLRTTEIERRLGLSYHPYHTQLDQLVQASRDKFGWSLVVDCHSMPSAGAFLEDHRQIDMVLGDCHGQSCAPAITQVFEDFLTKQGYCVTRNDPYAGGFTTSHYAHPAAHSHSIQIEINRALYLDESIIEPGPNFQRIAADMDALMAYVIPFLANWQGNTP